MAVVTGGKGKKRSKSGDIVLKDFGIEYAKSGRAMCAACEIKISKDELRIKKTVYDTEVGKKFGGQALWHHVECFEKMRNDLGFFSSGDVLPGFKDLQPEDKKKVKDTLKAIKAEDVPEVKKIKLEKKENGEEEKENKLYKAQNETFYKYKQQLESNLKKKDMATILEHNQMTVPQGNERVSEIIQFFKSFSVDKLIIFDNLEEES